jgi:thiol:disulfide interchange protein
MDFEALKAQIDAMVPVDIVSAEDVSVLPSPASSKANNSKVAAASFTLGILSFLFLHNQPASSTALLKAMEKDSMAISAAVCNGKPTIVDFYADW